jgi:hypothetical protein
MTPKEARAKPRLTPPYILGLRPKARSRDSNHQGSMTSLGEINGAKGQGDTQCKTQNLIIAQSRGKSKRVQDLRVDARSQETS